MGRQFDEPPADEQARYAPTDPAHTPTQGHAGDAPAASSSGEWTPPQDRREEPTPGRSYEPAPERPYEPAPERSYQAAREPAPEPAYESASASSYAAAEPAYDEDFSPFTMEEHAPRGRSRLLTLLMIALLIAALAAAFWFLAPHEWKERVGISAAAETPLQLMMTHSDRQKLASGNELLAVSGRVINPTDEQQNVPPIRAQLRSSSGKLVYSWTIAPPARTLPPGASATFNSAEVNVPSGGDELTITLGSAST